MMTSGSLIVLGQHMKAIIEKKNNGDRQEGQLYIETAFPLVNCSVLTSLKEVKKKKGEMCLLNKEQLKGPAFPK